MNNIHESNTLDQDNDFSFCTSDIGSIEVMNIDVDCGDGIDSVRFCLAKSCDLNEYVQLMEDLNNVLTEEEDCKYEFSPNIAEYNGSSLWGMNWRLAFSIIVLNIIRM